MALGQGRGAGASAAAFWVAETGVTRAAVLSEWPERVRFFMRGPRLCGLSRRLLGQFPCLRREIGHHCSVWNMPYGLEFAVSALVC